MRGNTGDEDVPWCEFNRERMPEFEPYENGDPFIRRFVDLEDAAGVRRASGDEEGAKLFDALRKLAETTALESWWYYTSRRGRNERP